MGPGEHVVWSLRGFVVQAANVKCSDTTAELLGKPLKLHPSRGYSS